MGLDIVALHSLLISTSKYVSNFLRCLTLGRQQVDVLDGYFEYICKTYGIKTTFNRFCEILLSDIGFKYIDSMDYSDYEKCSIIHNLNKPINDDLKNSFDLIFDGGFNC